MTNKSLIDTESERMAILDNFKSDVTKFNKNYNVECAVFGFNKESVAAAMREGYFEIHCLHDTLNSALEETRNTESGVFVFLDEDNQKYYASGKVFDGLSKTDRDHYKVLDIERMEIL